MKGRDERLNTIPRPWVITAANGEMNRLSCDKPAAAVVRDTLSGKRGTGQLLLILSKASKQEEQEVPP